MTTTPTAFGFNTPFQSQIDFLRQKLDLPTEKWDDILGRAHDRAFVVAGAAKADLLADLHQQLLTRAQDGAGLNAFRKDFQAIVAKHGWTGWTGEGTAEGVAWRTRVIYQTNMATSYAAGRHAQMSDPEVLKLHPYWRYIHSEGAMHPRPLHLAWHGLTLPHDHPFFQTHFAPNGWNCFPAETAVRCDARLGLKTWYAGEMVEFSTASGNHLAVTANHPILTRHGWVCAHQLNKGDQLIGAVGDVDALLVGVIDREQAPTSAKYLFESLAAQGLRVAPMAPNDFHGDAVLRKAKIHIAGSDRALMDVAKAARGEFIGESGFQLGLHRRVETPFIAVGPAQAAPIKSDAILAQDATYRGLGNTQARSDLGLAGEAATVEGENLSLDDGIARISDDPCSTQLALNAAGRALDRLPAQSFSLRSTTQDNPLAEQGTPQGIAAAAGLFGELLKANPTVVTLDEINEIRKYQWAGHVYDFVTATGLILAGGIIVSNCQCRITSVTRAEGERSARAGLGEPPAGWQALNPKTGAPVGIDKGFDYAPGATWHPNLDKYPYDQARQMVASNASDGVFERWHQHIASRVEADLLDAGYTGLSKGAVTDRLRQRLSMGEQYPVAVLPPPMVERMGVQTQVVFVSDYDLIKQQVSRAGQAFDALEYLQAQVTLDTPRLVVRENGQMTLFVSDAAGKWYAAVLQETSTGKAVYLKSFRRSSEKDALLQRKKGEVLLDSLPSQ